MNGKAIIYPYWENIARGYEDIVLIFTLAAALFLLYPAVLVVILTVYAWKHKAWTAKSVWLKLSDKVERKLEKMRARRQRKKKYKDQFDDEEKFYG